MPHKRAKRSVRERERSDMKHDLPPSQILKTVQTNKKTSRPAITSIDGKKAQNEAYDFPKSAARVLNAESVQSMFREKKRKFASGDRGEGGEGDGQSKKKKRRGDGDGGERALVKTKALEIKPGESLRHFNRRVEDDMRPLVRTAMASTTSVSKQKAKASEKTEDSQEPTRPKSKSTSSSNQKGKNSHSDEESDNGTSSHSNKRPQKELDFARTSSSVPKRLNDIVQAPPSLLVGSRIKKGVKKGADPSSNKPKKDGVEVVSAAQKRMMELEREKVIARYRELKAAREAKGS